mmetsp:Transcript_35128/g.46249  ORF Transcript_35128/g.46249 Transcript_35128/m.46249 type:complete len:221 (-) Transcript_35128:96-758(-)|eukprot:CAMPEP_0185579218 /NCGR_PEP_ID=MMETSP0434-20130131/13976_1 /TAXON_ID=626734 ORGANISM="Favella taraikaensis, Strain Fe Narragansett Bay" /NCGR_SAMPLE_ID=MMETSP0434 /ASSEMBLY_ACC=CAM_ASM_000379 /LENGTH=220 /DNA_ID=CAMNT_0028197197 /DNA_START=591 /DNA_END=1253 /DNA_ORIENTATION=-
MDAIFLEMEQTIFVNVRTLADCDGAGVERGKSVEVVLEKVLLGGQGIEHLHCALGDANVAHLFTGSLFNHLDVTDVVLGAHLGPAKGPVVRILDRQSFMLLAVLGTTVRGQVDVEAAIKEAERHGYVVARARAHPVDSIAGQAVHEHDRVESLVRLDVVADFARDSEGRKDVAVVSRDLDRLPAVAPVKHALSEGHVIEELLVARACECLFGSCKTYSRH